MALSREKMVGKHAACKNQTRKLGSLMSEQSSVGLKRAKFVTIESAAFDEWNQQCRGETS